MFDFIFLANEDQTYGGGNEHNHGSQYQAPEEIS
jgi:hypothetical protein